MTYASQAPNTKMSDRRVTQQRPYLRRRDGVQHRPSGMVGAAARVEQIGNTPDGEATLGRCDMTGPDTGVLRLHLAEKDCVFTGIGAATIHDYPTTQRFADSLINHREIAQRFALCHRPLSSPPPARHDRSSEPAVRIPATAKGTLSAHRLRHVTHTEPTRGTPHRTQAISPDLQRSATKSMIVHELAHLAAIECPRHRHDPQIEFIEHTAQPAGCAHRPSTAPQLREAHRGQGTPTWASRPWTASQLIGSRDALTPPTLRRVPDATRRCGPTPGAAEPNTTAHRSTPHQPARPCGHRPNTATTRTEEPRQTARLPVSPPADHGYARLRGPDTATATSR